MSLVESLQNQDIGSTLFALTLFTLIVLKLSSSKRVIKTKPPPSPPRLPIIGNLHQIGSSPHRSLAALSTQYGPLMLLHLGQKQVLVVSSANAAAQVLKTHDITFCDRPKSDITARLLYNYKDVSAAPYGEFWRHIRSLCVLQLLSAKRVQSFRSVREEETYNMMENIKESWMRSEPVDLSETVMTLANDIICRVALGRKYKDRRFKSMLRKLVGFLLRFNLGDFVPSLSWISKIDGLDSEVDRVAKEFDEFLDQVVKDHQAVGDTDSHKDKDFVDVLLQVKQETESLDMDTIKAIVLDMFAGGTDTTSSVLVWAMTELLRHPQVMKKLQNEVRMFKKHKDFLKEEDLVNMKYLKAVIKETLRLHPPLPLLVPRESRQAVKLMGYDIAAGTRVFVNAWAIGRDSGSWEEPEEFRPERFLENDVEVMMGQQGYKFIPFGAGRRGCPGIGFAMAVEEVALANLVFRFDWKLPGEVRAQDLDMVETSGLTIHRKDPLTILATPSDHSALSKTPNTSPSNLEGYVVLQHSDCPTQRP